MRIWGAVGMAIALAGCSSQTLCEQSCAQQPHAALCVEACEREREHHEEIDCQPDYDMALECRVVGGDCDGVDVRAGSAAAYGCAGELVAARACSNDPSCIGSSGPFSDEYNRLLDMLTWCEGCGRTGTSTWGECPYEPPAAR
jgi:hypothetical protein